jgi:simple sugar transport system substrate-binding protein
MMPKKYLTLYIILVIASFLASCGIATSTTATPTIPTKIPLTPTTTPTPYDYKDLTISMIMTGGESEWWVANINSFRNTAMSLGVNLKFYDRAAPGNFQSKDFQFAIDDPEVNVIVVNPIERIGWEELLHRAKNVGKIVIIIGREIDVPEDLYTTFVGNDFLEEGHKAGREMCKLLEGSEKKNLWELTGSEGNKAAIDRGKGFHEMAAQCGIVITNSQTVNWIAADSKQIMDGWLKENRDVQGVFAQNDEMGLGVIEALKEADLAPAKDVKIVSIDGERAALEAMIAGDLNVTVESSPLFAPQVYEAALKALNGETLPKWIPVQEGVFRMDDPNLEEVFAKRKY